jgi:hypothetical protein
LRVGEHEPYVLRAMDIRDLLKDKSTRVMSASRGDDRRGKSGTVERMNATPAGSQIASNSYLGRQLNQA